MSDDKRAADARPLKLFVVGESSGDPATWSEWPNRSFVLAHDAEEAVGLIGDLSCSSGGVAEVVARLPFVLCHDESGLVNNL
jgi:hypothetical protein